MEMCSNFQARRQEFVISIILGEIEIWRGGLDHNTILEPDIDFHFSKKI